MENKKQEVVKKEETKLVGSVGDKYIQMFADQAEQIMVGMGFEFKPEVKLALFNIGLACEKALKDKKITWEQVNRDGLASKLLFYAQLNLNPANNEVYIIPYSLGKNDKGTEVFTLNFEESYLGKKKKVKKFSSDELIDAIAFLVREGDVYEPHINLFGGDTVDYEPLPFNTGKILGAVCYLKYKDETRNRIVEMPISELEQVKEASKNKMNGKLSPAWIKWESEMYKKAVLKRALKDVNVEVDIEYQQAYLDTESYDDANYDLNIKEVKLPPIQEVRVDENIQEAEYEEPTVKKEEQETNDIKVDEFE